MTQQDADFDEMLKEAQKLGYAERDPGDDIDGLDVQYKVVLTLMKAFDAVVSPSVVPTFGIRNISSQDIAYAKSCGRTVKLIGRGSEKDGHISAWVMPAMVSDSDPFANISLNYNALESVSDTLGTAVFTGQGAGSLPTAHAVVQDLIDISQTDVTVPQLCEKKTDLSDVYGTYYIRSEKLSEFNAFLESDTFGGAAVTKKVSLKQLLEKIKEVQDSSLFIAEVVQYD
jgi:homoserine dehydrogenase